MTDEVRSWIKAEVHRLYGDRVVRVILVGSRARGDHLPSSDWDVVVVLRDGRSINDIGPLINEKLTTPDGKKVEIVLTDQDGLNHPGTYMTDCKKWGEEL